MALIGCGAVLSGPGCGRRGPPLPPLRVVPAAPEAPVLRQEAGEVEIRWTAPRTDVRGVTAAVGLRRAVVLYRVLDLDALAAAQRAARRAATNAEPAPASEGDPPITEAEAAPAPADSPEETRPTIDAETEPAPADPPEGTPPTTDTEPAPAPADPPEGTPPTTVAEAAPAPADPPEGTPAGEPGAQKEGTGAAPTGPEAPPPATPGGGAGGELPDPGAPEPFDLDLSEPAFEVLAEVPSRVPGEELRFRAPLDPAWVGRRLEVQVRYEASGASGEASPARALDVSGDPPAPEGLEIRVEQRAITLLWNDISQAPGGAPRFGHALYEVVRRRGDVEETVGQATGPSRADPSGAVFGEEVCYRVRLVFAGSEEPGELPDPGPVAEDPASTAAPAPGDAPLPWTPLPARVSGAGASAQSLGPFSPEECVVPLDVFPPPMPTGLRVVWRPERTELTWNFTDPLPPPSDLAGFHVYRAGPGDPEPVRLTGEPVPGRSFDDENRDPGLVYAYSVSAVDDAIPPNESRRTTPISATPRAP